uniref:Uncharacterized protein n=1 Tax=Trichobilharzia regenti TaxID=157069 RepID=A0AA85KD73_TRIRE|nr:unnamed protein product [Trichobilharzia regenti]
MKGIFHDLKDFGDPSTLSNLPKLHGKVNFMKDCIENHQYPELFWKALQRYHHVNYGMTSVRKHWELKNKPSRLKSKRLKGMYSLHYKERSGLVHSVHTYSTSGTDCNTSNF